MRRLIAVGAAAAVTLPGGLAATGAVPHLNAAHPSASHSRATAAAHRYRYAFPVRGCKVSYSHYHHDYPATDIFAPRNCKVVAVISGRVDEVSDHDRWSSSTNRGSQRGGRSVSIVGVDGVRYYGSHLQRIARGIKPGVRVRRGQLLGRVGNSGDARGIATHLHFGISWPTRHGVWWVRRGEVWPWPYLDAWRGTNPHKSPVRAVRRALRHAGRRVPQCHADC